MKILSVLFILTIWFTQCKSGSNNHDKIIVGAEQVHAYSHMLSNKKVGLMVNHTSMVDSVHLLDFLISKQVDVVKIFAVEHGFRGNAAAGEEFNNSIDPKTQLPIVSLYGKNKKPSAQQMSDIDIVIFDMQDVGCRFYTYISSLHYLMQACAENSKELIVLDRPNPNGDYVAGPVLDLKYQSFVGMHPIPVVHGCTVAEIALMINGEGWLGKNLHCKLTVVPVKNYTHLSKYEPPVKPSPNLPNYTAIRLYPSLCFFEAANISIGRGTSFPFQVIGYPGCTISEIEFTPQSLPGISNNPLFENQPCSGTDLRQISNIPHFTLEYFIAFYNLMNNKDRFWKSKRWIELLAGNDKLYNQINEKIPTEDIQASWQPQLNNYKQTRKRYLLYPDFE